MGDMIPACHDGIRHCPDSSVFRKTESNPQTLDVKAFKTDTRGNRTSKKTGRGRGFRHSRASPKDDSRLGLTGPSVLAPCWPSWTGQTGP